MEQRPFTPDEHQTWAAIMKVQRPRRRQQLLPFFQEGLDRLDMDVDVIPDIHAVNKKLKALTGWQAVLTSGFVDKEPFYKMLYNKQFPIGNFIRDSKDLNYTPEPDIVHDLYGHIPFFANSDYAKANEQFGKAALKWINNPQRLTELERLYWFTFEFGLVKTPQGNRIFGAGIASSIGECEYALSNKPTVLPFDVEVVMNTDFRIDIMQEKLFLLESSEQLYKAIGSL
jgi:phenylalanine-4-hydroxylase